MIILPSGIAVLEDDSHISCWVSETGRLDHDDYSLPIILQHINPGDTVIDAGAFIGDHTWAYLRRVGPSGRVIAFEINRKALECLRLNCPEAVIVECGLSDGDYDVGYEESQNAGAGHINDDGGSIQLIALDSLELGPCEFIKLDIEGCEFEALAGAEKTIRSSRPKMWIEINKGALARRGCTPEKVTELVHSFGYTTHRYPENFDEQYDILCIPL